MVKDIFNFSNLSRSSEGICIFKSSSRTPLSTFSNCTPLYSSSIVSNGKDFRLGQIRYILPGLQYSYLHAFSFTNPEHDKHYRSKYTVEIVCKQQGNGNKLPLYARYSAHTLQKSDDNTSKRIVQHRKGISLSEGLRNDEDDPILDSLNEQQKMAVQAEIGPIKVVAGPGSGKTRVLTHRVAYMVLRMGVQPRNILCITFTNRAAMELKERLIKIVGEKFNVKLPVGTFHGIASRMLRETIQEIPDCGRDQDFVIYDQQDCVKLMKSAAEKVTGRPMPKGADKILNIYGEVRRMVARNKIAGRRGLQAFHWSLRSEDQSYLDMNVGKNMAHEVFKVYEELKRGNNAVDFDDLMELVVQLLHTAPAAFQYYRARYQHLLVDEFQDTDETQYEMVRILTSKRQSLFVVGDIDQAIYSWRGADPSNMQTKFGADFPKAKIVQLPMNYRSTASIVSSAARVIVRSEIERCVGNKMGPLTLQAVKPSGAPVSFAYVGSDRDEAHLVASTIRRLTTEHGMKFGDFAVLYRKNMQSRLFEEALTRGRIPFVVLSGTPFYSRKEVKDLLAYLRLVANPCDDVALQRIINVPPRAIGGSTMQKLSDWSDSLGSKSLAASLQEFGTNLPAKEVLPIPAKAKSSVVSFCTFMAKLRVMADQDSTSVGDLLREIIVGIQYMEYVKSYESKVRGEETKEGGADRTNLVKELQSIGDRSASTFGSGRNALISFLEEITLISDFQDEQEGSKSGQLQANAVKLLTIHGSKGLEFDTVFVPGMEEHILPSLIEDTAERIAEERRLFYVAMTRAKERLYLLSCETRYKFGKQSLSTISRFIEDIHPLFGKNARDPSLDTRRETTLDWHT